MSLMELLKQEGIDSNDKEKVELLQKFYQEGFTQGMISSHPEYDYSIKYRQVVTRLLELFRDTINERCLKRLELSLDKLDEFKRENMIL